MGVYLGVLVLPSVFYQHHRVSNFHTFAMDCCPYGCGNTQADSCYSCSFEKKWERGFSWPRSARYCKFDTGSPRMKLGSRCENYMRRKRTGLLDTKSTSTAALAVELERCRKC